MPRAYPRVFLDVEIHRPQGPRGRVGFFSKRSRLIAISLAVSRASDNTVIAVRVGSDEAALLRWTLSKLRPLARRRNRGVLSGYNILALDIPFLLYRASHAGPGTLAGLRKALLRGFIHVDLFQAALLAYSGRGLPSMASFYAALRAARGLEPSAEKGSGYSVHELYERGDLRAIESYARQEMEQLVEAYSLLFDPGPVLGGNVPEEWSGLPRLLRRTEE